MSGAGFASLGGFQDAFAAALIANDDTDVDERLHDVVSQPGFAVYRNTVMSATVDALAANFPSVVRLVGERWFRAAAAEFARTNLPREPALIVYGEAFADFLEAFAPARELPYLPVVARLDRLWLEAHIAADDAVLPAAALTTLAPEQLASSVLRPHATARWLHCASLPAYSIWRRNHRTEKANETTDITWQGEGALLVRPRADVLDAPLSAADCAFLDVCAAGRSVLDAAQAASR